MSLREFLHDPVRRRFGGFGRFRSRRARVAYGMACGAALVGSVVLGREGRSQTWIGFGDYCALLGWALAYLVSLMAAVQASVGIAFEHDVGTFEAVLLSTYPRDALGRAIALGAFLRGLSLGLLPALAWIGYGLAAFQWGEFLPFAAAALLELPAAAFMGACIGCHCSQVSRGILVAVFQSGLYTLVFSGLIGCSSVACTAFSAFVASPVGAVIGVCFWQFAWGWAFWVDNVVWYRRRLDDLGESDGGLPWYRWI